MKAADLMVLVVPIPMFFSHYVFNEAFYTFWVVMTM